MTEGNFADQLSRLDAALHKHQEKRARAERQKSLRQQRLNEIHRSLLMLFQARARAVSVRLFRLIVEACQSELADLSPRVKELFEPAESESFLKKIGFVQMSLASSAAPAMRGYLGHIVGIVFEAPDRCVILVFPTREVALGSLEPLDGQVARLEVAEGAGLHRHEEAIDAALIAGLKRITEKVETERE